MVLGLSGTIQAAEMKAGDWISKSNYEQVKGNTFQGHKIEDMIFPKMKEQILQWGLQIQLKEYEKYEYPPVYYEFTEKYKGTVKLEDGGRKISNYVAGQPFELDPDDPLVGWKCIWNTFYGRQLGDCIVTPKFGYVFVDMKRGVERTQWGEWGNYYYKNRHIYPPVPVHETKENLYSKNLLFFVYPFDVKGLGVMAINYDDDRLQENWAYLRSVRRVRRLSAAAWMDPIGGTDQLYDDQEIFNAYPAWYQDYKYMGKKKLLIPRNVPYDIWLTEEDSIIDQYPRMDLTNPPYCQPLGEYEPADVHILETIPPDYHPYSKKVCYIDEEAWKPVQAVCYDRKGEYWKYFNIAGSPKPGEKGLDRGEENKYMMSIWGHMMDFQKMHATNWNNCLKFTINPKGIDDKYFSTERLRQAGR
jgi:hypothetical protein